jgi:hypothetical protein
MERAMKGRSEIVGGLFTGAYLICIAVLVYWKRATIPCLGLNEIGDFLAGVFGPVAFLWLVLGYFQQGRELRNSSQALKVQAAELRNSVDQQKELVVAARAQVDTGLEALRSARELRQKSIQPNFIAEASQDPGNLQLTIKNHGAAITDVIFQGAIPCPQQFPIFEQGQAVRFDMSPQTRTLPITEVLFIRYTDADQNKCEDRFRVNILMEGLSDPKLKMRVERLPQE